MSVLLHVPHASTHIPPEVRCDIVVSDAVLAQEVREATDHHTDGIIAGLANGTTVRSVVNAHSRLVVDPERFIDPSQEITEVVGRGVVATHTVNKARFRDDTTDAWQARRQSLIEAYYVPYHAHMDRQVSQMLDAYTTVTIIDVHSFPQAAQPYELDPAGERPQLCIGTDSNHTSDALRTIVTECADAFGFEVALNTPFSGTFVPIDHYGEQRVGSVMLEFRRDMFSDELTTTPHPGIVRCRAFTRELITSILASTDSPTR